MRMPFDGSYRVTQRYGSNAAAYKRFGMLGHNGIDFGLPGKTAIKAVRAGRWNRYSDPTGYGINGVLTDEDGGEWIHGHLERHVVADGARVNEGTTVAYSDNTGNSTGNHLHFGYRPKGYDPNNGYFGWINPRPFLPLSYRVLLQASHNGDGSGAPREAEWTQRFAAAVAARLTASGVQTATFGGFWNQSIPAAAAALLGQDWDLCWCLHYDGQAGVTLPSGCCIARGDAETEYWEADRAIAAWKAAYPKATGVPLVQKRVNPNMTQYYVWRHTSYVTPGIIVEHGYGQPGVGGDAPLLWDRLDRVAEIEAGAILTYLGVAAPPPGGGDDEELAMDTTPEERAAMQGDFQALGIPVNMETALMKRAALARKRNEWRGPAVTGEYHTTNREGKVVVRQRFSGGALDYHEDTGETFWTEPVLYPEDAR